MDEQQFCFDIFHDKKGFALNLATLKSHFKYAETVKIKQLELPTETIEIPEEIECNSDNYKMFECSVLSYVKTGMLRTHMSCLQGPTFQGTELIFILMFIRVILIPFCEANRFPVFVPISFYFR